jgi:hypothetical protein
MRIARAPALRAFVVAAALLAAACEVPAPEHIFPALSYAHQPTQRLDVAAVEIVDDYVPPLAKPNVEHEFPVTPAGAAARWGADRIAVAGAEGKARFVIVEAAVRETTLEKRRGVVGAFYVDQEYRYDGVLEVMVEVRSPRGFRNAFATARASYSRTVPEDITVNDRMQVFYEITEALMRSLDTELEQNIRQHLAPYLL